MWEAMPVKSYPILKTFIHEVHTPGASCPVVPMEITFIDNGGNLFVLDEFIEQMNSYI